MTYHIFTTIISAGRSSEAADTRKFNLVHWVPGERWGLAQNFCFKTHRVLNLMNFAAVEYWVTTVLYKRVPAEITKGPSIRDRESFYLLPVVHASFCLLLLAFSPNVFLVSVNYFWCLLILQSRWKFSFIFACTVMDVLIWIWGLTESVLDAGQIYTQTFTKTNYVIILVSIHNQCYFQK